MSQKEFRIVHVPGFVLLSVSDTRVRDKKIVRSITPAGAMRMAWIIDEHVNAGHSVDLRIEDKSAKSGKELFSVVEFDTASASRLAESLRNHAEQASDLWEKERQAAEQRDMEYIETAVTKANQPVN